MTFENKFICNLLYNDYHDAWFEKISRNVIENRTFLLRYFCDLDVSVV